MAQRCVDAAALHRRQFRHGRLADHHPMMERRIRQSLQAGFSLTWKRATRSPRPLSPLCVMEYSSGAMDDSTSPTTTASRGRAHSPSLATLAGLVLPGAGQSYNGRPVRGALVLFLSPLILPWLLGSLSARSHAKSMNREGGRYGKGGVLWLILHAWLVFNFVLAVAAALTMAGVLR